MRQGKLLPAFCTVWLLAAAGSLHADGGVTFTDIALGGGAGVTYQKMPTPRLAQVPLIIAQSPIPTPTFFNVVRPQQFPQKPWGSVGVVILDYDNDGDLDIYATNGPGADNSLYSNQLKESGQLTFVDVGAAAGVGAFDQDSAGACSGDIDNDGDADLYVVATGEPNRLFENNGDGTFTDITAAAGVGGDSRHAIGCSFGDFNGDGLLDVVVGNTYDNWLSNATVLSTTGSVYPGLEHNYLFMNRGGNVFTDESAASGIENVAGAAGPGLSGGSFTWAITSVDYDLDGDVDVFFGDTQGSATTQGIGFNRPFVNDGTGHFVDRTVESGLVLAGSWMGFDFGDFNCDGLLDFFSTDLGYIGNAPSRWFLQNPNGTFTQNRAGNLRMTPFGWGTSVFDYDNDGDGDIVYHGGMDVLQFIVYDNPGVILQNQGNCTADFAWDSSAILTEHRTRSVQGVAVGDLNGDGFEDIVSIGDSETLVAGRVLILARQLTGPTGSPFDSVSLLDFLWLAINPGFQTYDPITPLVIGPGTLAVEVSSADNGNGWVQLEAKGSAGVLAGGKVPRDGIGAVVSFTPDGGKTSIRPVIGGSSYASQDALPANFGLGAAAKGTAEVLWPGAIRNKLFDVKAGEKLVLPHIPCSYDRTWNTFGQYNSCVIHALNTYKQQGVIDAKLRKRLHESAQRAYHEAHP
ncbi:MAG: CRTAC1 family protein [Thermoanaerobaculia bacterium]|nr:CRTAC1 family protein [Thermoanaerobaculia bacterium]